MEGETSVSALPWCWVIESLARCQQVSVASLCDLLTKAPPLPGKSGKEAKELVALRCLEDFFGSHDGLRDKHLASHLSRSGFDSAESFEDILQRILHETSGLDQLKDASDELKLDVCSIIDRKKASLPRSTLELLQNTIVEGTHPLAASFKEFSGLPLQNQCVQDIPSCGGNPTSSASSIDKNGHGSPAMLAEGHNDSAKPGIGDEPVQANLPNGYSLHCERDTSHCSVDNYVQETASLDRDNHAPPGKKLKLDEQFAVQLEQHSVPSGGSNRSNDAEPEEDYQFSKANGTHNGNSNRDVFGDPTKIYVQNPEQTQRNNGKPLPEKIDLEKKLTFLSSECAFSEDSFTMTDTEKNVCMKCNKGGQLLICVANTCPMAFHERCLSCSASFDDQGKFYCPFCAYSRAISEYVKAKEKASLARKELSLFLGGSSSYQPEHDSKRALGDDVNQQGQNEDKTAEPKDGVNVPPQVANNLQFRSSNDKEQELSAPSAPTAENASVTAAPPFSSEDRQGADTIMQLGKNVTGTQNQRPDDHGPDGCKLSNGNEKITNASKEGAELERKEESAGRQVSERCGEASSESISNSDGYSEVQTSKTTSSLPSPRPISAVPLNQRLRRKKVPWTVEEEEMLKKGVQAFVQGDNRAVPWKNILEYGGSVFQKGRTAIDLKDKWRNILRGGSSKTK